MDDADLRRAGAVLEIDLAAIRANWRSLAARTRGACAAVVKADAYGLGAAVVAPTLHDEGARRFFVAHLDEALVLQPALPTGTEVLVLNALPPGAEGDRAAAGIVPVLNSLPQVDARTDLASRKGRPLPAALQVDTGMSRMGSDEAELDALAVDPTRLLGINLRLVMSHLACAERQDHEMNRAQLARLEAARRALPAAPASLANSSGIFLGPAFHFDVARPDAALSRAGHGRVEPDAPRRAPVGPHRPDPGHSRRRPRRLRRRLDGAAAEHARCRRWSPTVAGR